MYIYGVVALKQVVEIVQGFVMHKNKSIFRTYEPGELETQPLLHLHITLKQGANKVYF